PPGFHLLACGRRQLGSVQLASVGRRLDGSPDAIRGYVQSMLGITDPEVLATSGERFHPIVSPSGNLDDAVQGTVFRISAAELEAADRYEVSDYLRERAPLASGGQAWVYVRR